MSRLFLVTKCGRGPSCKPLLEAAQLYYSIDTQIYYCPPIKRMHFDLHSESSTPIYRQIVEQLRREIGAGLLKPGDALPSVRQVAELHTINPMTVSRAYSLLEAEGLLIRQRGKPMCVAAQPGGQDSAAKLLQLIIPSLEQVAREARQLNLDTDSVIAELARLMKEDRK